METPDSRPWQGLASYTEAQSSLFFGREEESEALLSLVEAGMISVLFGTSGLGKSSLLQAGLVPRLRAHGFLPVQIRLDHAGEGGPLDAQILRALVASANATLAEGAPGPRTAPPPVVGGDSLWAHFHRQGARLWSERQQPVIPVLILDQFEELFTVGQETEERREGVRELLRQLIALVRNRPPEELRRRVDEGGEDEARAVIEAFSFDQVGVRLVLSLREDYLAQLEELSADLPAIRQSRLRLLPMSKAQAVEVIERPALGRDILAEGAVDAILQFVVAERRSVDTAFDDDRPVDPAILSLACEELDRRRGDGQITRTLIESQQASILESFYERTLAEVAPAPELQRRVQSLIEDELLLAAGTHRDSRAVEDVIARLALPGSMIERLVNLRLLRYEQRAGGPRRIELTHDVLCAPVRRSRDRRRQSLVEAHAAEARKAAETARLEKEAAEARERRTRRLLVTAVLLLVVAIAGVAAGVMGLDESRNQAARAMVAQGRAEDAARQAKESEERAKLSQAKLAEVLDEKQEYLNKLTDLGEKLRTAKTKGELDEARAEYAAFTQGRKLPMRFVPGPHDALPDTPCGCRKKDIACIMNCAEH